MPASRFLKIVRETGQIPICSFYLPASTSRNPTVRAGPRPVEGEREEVMTLTPWHYELTMQQLVVRISKINQFAKLTNISFFNQIFVYFFQPASNQLCMDHRIDHKTVTLRWLSKREGTLIVRSCFGECEWKNEWCHGARAGGLPGEKEHFRTRCGVIIGRQRVRSWDRVFLRFRNDPTAFSGFPSFLARVMIL